MAKKAEKKTKKKKKRFDADNGDHWREIPSKGQLFMLAIGAFNGAKFEGSEVFGSREKAKEIISKLKDDGVLD